MAFFQNSYSNFKTYTQPTWDHRAMHTTATYASKRSKNPIILNNPQKIRKVELFWKNYTTNIIR